MKKQRCLCDFIILTTIPHIFTLYYTASDICYTTIIAMATMSSFSWHKTHESCKKLLIIDYFCASVLCSYEVYRSEDKLFTIQINTGLLFINKLMDVLSKYKILKYGIGHCIFHIISCYKTYYMAKKIYTSDF